MIARSLYALSARLPCRLIQRTPGEPYLERYLISAKPGRYRYLHRFVAADMDEDLHDHPWPWAWSLVLAGGYCETWLDRIDPRVPGGLVQTERWRRAGHFHRISGEDHHRIGRCLPETWTLFCHGDWDLHRKWGFLDLQHDDITQIAVAHHRPFERQHDPGAPWWESRDACADALEHREPFMVPGGRQDVYDDDELQGDAA